MSTGPNPIYDDTRAIHHHPDGEHMTQQPSRLGTLAAVAADIARNPLLARFADQGLGKALTGAEIDAVANFVAVIENSKRQMPAAPASYPQQLTDSAREPGMPPRAPQFVPQPQGIEPAPDRNGTGAQPAAQPAAT